MMATLRRWLRPCHVEPVSQHQRTSRMDTLVQHAQASSRALVLQSFDSITSSQAESVKLQDTKAAIDDLLSRMDKRKS